MKRIVECPVCKQLVGYYQTYKATVERYEEIQGVPLPVRKREVRICRGCATQAGYKVKSKVTLLKSERQDLEKLRERLP